MLRRRLHVAVASVACLRFQTATSGGGDTSAPGDGGATAPQDPIDTLAEIADASPIDVAAARSAGGGGASDGMSQLSRFVRDNDAPQYVSPHQLVATAEAALADRLKREALKPTDVFGGQFRPDYFRDPAEGYEPQYAPRNFAEGGRVEYHHAVSPLPFELAAAARSESDHDLDRQRDVTRGARDALRRSGGRHLDDVPTPHVKGGVVPSTDVQLNAAFSSSMLPHSAAVLRSTWSPTDAAPATGVPSPPAAAAMDGERLDELIAAAESERQHQRMLETMRDEVHGLRDWERSEASASDNGRMSFRGYDADRAIAMRTQQAYGTQALTPLVAPAPTKEALSSVRANAVPPTEALLAKAFARNTVSQEPVLGEALADLAIEAAAAQKRSAAVDGQRLKDQQLGIGRQGPLVTEGGPDKRTIRLHTNDERLLHAASFAQSSYSLHDNTLYDHVYARGDTTNGVGHMLANKFDMDKRVWEVASGTRDANERQTLYYGVPLRQQIDEVVKRRFGAKAERPVEYFMPFPTGDDMRLFDVFSDVEGFPLFYKQKPETYEFDLFRRYRAHHHQRRWLALRTGLEPRPNETIEERDARRLQLDILCEATPFDPSRFAHLPSEKQLTASMLRNWFGVYLLPSPTVVGRALDAVAARTGVDLAPPPRDDDPTVPDEREHLLSGRYISRLLSVETLQGRLGRGYIREVLRRAPEPAVPLRMTSVALKNLTRSERIMYETYVALLVDKHTKVWKGVFDGRRWLPERQQYGTAVKHYSVEVVELRAMSSGATQLVAASVYDASLRPNATSGPSRTSPAAVAAESFDGWVLVPGSRRVTPFVVVKSASGDVFDLEEAAWSRLSLAVPSPDANHHLNYGFRPVPYNRNNYIEAQDFLWERATQQGAEGWTTAVHWDGLLPGLPVRARRVHSLQGPAGRRIATGDAERAEIVGYSMATYDNPTNLVTVRFLCDSVEQAVPLGNVQVWQATWMGPSRTAPMTTRQYSAGYRRFVDFADPKGRGRASDATNPHFLQKYAPTGDTSIRRFQSYKSISDIDSWKETDHNRPENHRLLSGVNSPVYLRTEYHHYYTPWEFILHQENEQPLINEQLRSDNIGPSLYFAPNRYWRYKRRPVAYIRNFANEIRDLFGHVDAITPWKKAQHIREFWEVREHHPMPRFNQPELAMHRNSASLLPQHLWEADKRTGKVHTLKDTLKDYHGVQEYPTWVQL